MSEVEKEKQENVVSGQAVESLYVSVSGSSHSSHDDGREPTEEELATLRRVSEKIPISCWLVAIVELAERFTYYGLSAPFQNYMQNAPGDTPPGVLNLKNQGATALSYFFQFWCYVTPILGAYIADTFWGKYKTIFVFCIIYMLGVFVLFITSVPSITSHSTALGGYVVGIIIIGIGTGGVKSNVAPLIADQVQKTSPVIKVLKSGERVIQDPNVTIQNVFMFFYLMINIGSLSVIATTELEKHVGFWASFLLPFCFFFIAIGALVLGRNQYVKVPVSDKIISNCFKCTFVAIKNKFNLDAAKPSLNPNQQFPWDDRFVDEVKRALYACKVFLFYPIYWVVYGQMLNNFVSQAGQMETHGLPNDILQAIDSIAIILFIPICERFIYPFIRKFTPFRAITKISWGFMFGAAAMAYAAVLQHFIYKAGPCYDHPLACDPKYKNTPNRIHIAWQVPAYCFIAISEILASITGLEYAYTKAPVRMKSFIMALFLLMTAFGSALGIAMSSTSVDPKLVWTYTGLGVSCFIAGVLFWFTFKHYNYKEDDLNALDYQKDSLVTEASIIDEEALKR
ncbi:peptide transporter ptr2 [Scheffersomyces spartinae]|uniref:Peptide transporter ptr2 n=1 Tax=Scheffersomyces spartinae TaxID=45513 RepID=A0A9P8AHA3_9ASCO|nr:peptide transporter ptr2 [Scheffersomyces spartinae]KAG7193121.1 peptide transporter ptr2 [Scheffersomyces spartinae]